MVALPAPSTDHMRLVFLTKPLWHPLQIMFSDVGSPLPSNCTHLQGLCKQQEAWVCPSEHGLVVAAPVILHGSGIKVGSIP